MSVSLRALDESDFESVFQLLKHGQPGRSVVTVHRVSGSTVITQG
jgi:hypothetical protein